MHVHNALAVFASDSREILDAAVTAAHEYHDDCVGIDHVILATARHRLLGDHLRQEGCQTEALAAALHHRLHKPHLHRMPDQRTGHPASPPRFDARLTQTMQKIIAAGPEVRLDGRKLLDVLLADHPDHFAIGDLRVHGFGPRELAPVREATQVTTKKAGAIEWEDYISDVLAEVKAGKTDPALDREVEVDRILNILVLRDSNSPMLLGESGVGKTAVVASVAKYIDEHPDDPRVVRLGRPRIVALEMVNVVAGAGHQGEFEERLKSVIAGVREAKQRTILFVDECHTLIGAGKSNGPLDAGNILKQPLSKDLQCIGATTFEEYRRHILKDPALDRRFQAVKIEEPNFAQAARIAFDKLPVYESHHRVAFGLAANTYQKVLVPAARMAKTIGHLPNSLLKVVDKVGGVLAKEGGKRPSTLADFITATAELANRRPEGLAGDAGFYLNLPSVLKKRIINQEEAIDATTSAMLVKKFGSDNPDNPVVILLAGAPGVGKTALAETLEEELFGEGRHHLVRIDMAAFSEQNSVAGLKGTMPGYIGYEDGGVLTNAARRHPDGVILLDEIEKAHPDALNLLLSIFEGGRLTDGEGQTVDFRNNIFIATSNAGADVLISRLNSILNPSENGAALTKRRQANAMVDEFGKPLLSRMVVVKCNDLTKDDLAEIVRIQIEKRNGWLRGKGIDITLRTTPAADRFIASQDFDKGENARAVNKYLGRTVDLKIAFLNAAGKIPEGGTLDIDVDAEGLGLTYSCDSAAGQETFARQSPLQPAA